MVVLRDILALTKLNYNTCIYGDGVPVTLRFADAVGENLKAGPYGSNTAARLQALYLAQHGLLGLRSLSSTATCFAAQEDVHAFEQHQKGEQEERYKIID